MGKKSTDAEIAAFLKTIRAHLAAGQLRIVSRRKHLQSLLQHGITESEIHSHIGCLDVSNYHSGPDPKS